MPKSINQHRLKLVILLIIMGCHHQQQARDLESQLDNPPICRMLREDGGIFLGRWWDFPPMVANFTRNSDVCRFDL